MKTTHANANGRTLNTFSPLFSDIVKFDPDMPGSSKSLQAATTALKVAESDDDDVDFVDEIKSQSTKNADFAVKIEESEVLKISDSDSSSDGEFISDDASSSDVDDITPNDILLINSQNNKTSGNKIPKGGIQSLSYSCIKIVAIVKKKLFTYLKRIEE